MTMGVTRELWSGKNSALHYHSVIETSSCIIMSWHAASAGAPHRRCRSAPHYPPLHFSLSVSFLLAAALALRFASASAWDAMNGFSCATFTPTLLARVGWPTFWPSGHSAGIGTAYWRRLADHGRGFESSPDHDTHFPCPLFHSETTLPVRHDVSQRQSYSAAGLLARREHGSPSSRFVHQNEKGAIR